MKPVSTVFKTATRSPTPILQLHARVSQLVLNNQKASSYTEQFRGVMLGLKRWGEGDGAT